MFNTKKILSVIVPIAIILASLYPSQVEAGQVKPQKASYSITINTKVIDQTDKKYPYLVYNQVPYIPLSPEDKALLGLKSSWVAKTKKIFVNSSVTNPDAFALSQAYKASTLKDNKPIVATTNPHRLFLNGRLLTPNTMKNPALNYRSTTYLPVDWDTMVNHFGWYYHFDAVNGLVISTNEVPLATKKKQLAVYKKEIKVYQKASNTSEVIGVAQAGQIFIFDSGENGWYKVNLANNKHGYIYKDGVDVDLSRFKSLYRKDPVIKATPSNTANTANTATKAPVQTKAINKKVEVNGDVVNLRSGPGTTYEIKASVKKNDILQAIGEADNWYKVNYQGQTLWIAGWLTSAPGSVPKGDVLKAPEDTVDDNIGNINNVPTNQNYSTEQSTVNYLNRQFSQGQSTVSFDIGSSAVSMDSSRGGELILRIKNAKVGNLGKLADGLPPFNHLEVVASGKDVLLKAGVDSGDFFRFSQNNIKFDIIAVDKHKNGHVGLAGKVIVVDPGHGSYEARGKDYGAAGKSGVTEYDVVTPISMKLKAKLEANGAKVILTRGEAFKTISLSERAYVANNNNADAFVSIHADSFPSNTKVSGSKVFYYDGNARLTTQVQSEVRKALATAIADQIRPVSGRAQVNMANFAVNRENRVPSVLVETGFLSNPEEEERLASSDYQDQMAQAICEGLKNYFSY